MIIIDEEKIFDIIEARKPTSVALNGPDGLLPKVQDLTLRIGKKYGIPAYLLADTTWGTCDLNSNGAKVLNAEILFNIGHTNSMETFEKNVIMIDAFDDISFDRVIEKCTELLLGKTISLITDSRCTHSKSTKLPTCRSCFITTPDVPEPTWERSFLIR